MSLPDMRNDDANHDRQLTKDLIAKKRDQIALFAGYITLLQEITSSENLLSEINRRIDTINDIFWAVNAREMNTRSFHFRYMLGQEHSRVSSGPKFILLTFYKNTIIRNIKDKIQTLTIVSSFLKDEVEKLERQQSLSA